MVAEIHLRIRGGGDAIGPSIMVPGSLDTTHGMLGVFPVAVR